jgi:hypothetical protein
VDGDSNNAVSFFVAALDFVLDPWPEGGLLANADDGYGTPLKVVVDPAFDGGVAAAFDGFPFGVVEPSGVGVGGALGDPRVSDLADAPDVAVVVEAEEDFSRHGFGLGVANAIKVPPSARLDQKRRKTRSPWFPGRDGLPLAGVRLKSTGPSD